MWSVDYVGLLYCTCNLEGRLDKKKLVHVFSFVGWMLVCLSVATCRIFLQLRLSEKSLTVTGEESEPVLKVNAGEDGVMVCTNIRGNRV